MKEPYIRRDYSNLKVAEVKLKSEKETPSMKDIKLKIACLVNR